MRLEHPHDAAPAAERYELVWRNKYLATDAETLDDLIRAHQHAVDRLVQLRDAGVTLDPDSNLADDYAVLLTADSAVAERFDFEPVMMDDEDDEDAGPDHPVVSVEWRGRHADLDVEMAPVILALWKAGVDTRFCCQEALPGTAYIAFPTADDAKRFLDRVAVYPTDHATDGRYRVWGEPFGTTLYARLATHVQRRAGENWQYHAHPVNQAAVREWGGDGMTETYLNAPAFEFMVSVHFPKADIPLILDRLRAAQGGDRRVA